ncbi:MAG: succinate dehydrogenase, hydrophobic membrane anchor protein [Chromatiales bacterium]|jgi:succinate dehydrogenase / fumarate reductase membrane anchor subunit|nr:succinate dehydrogenase, hydrophobic membrane anchor protein [Chromatiales bacterium]
MSRRASGLRAWLWQRLSAIYMVLYLVVAGGALLLWPPVSFDDWRASVATPLASVTTALFFGSLLMHAWVGARDVLIDYVRPFAPRLLLFVLLGLMLIGSGLWILKILYFLQMDG